MNDRSWEDAWDEQYGTPEAPAPKPQRPRRERRSPRTRSVAVAAAILGVTISPFAVAAAGDALREGVRNGTTSKETQIIGEIDASSAATGGYVTRQSNLSDTGGGAVYGCRSEGGTGKNPCLRVNNLNTGLAFEFNSRNGLSAGSITVGTGGDTKTPFTTNATGVATGLNADRLDSLNASQIVDQAVAASKTRWVLVNAAGQIEAQSGGFTVASGYVANPAGAAGNVYINAGSDLTNKGLSATIALQNQTEQDGNGNTNGRQAGADQNAEFSGEISATRCAITGVVVCAPPGTNTNTHFVVSPRLSDGQVTSEGNRKRFYVTITE